MKQINIVYTKEFLNNLELYGNTKKSLIKNIYDFKNFIEINGFNFKIFNSYNINSLGKNFFRIKFIPYRLIIKVFDNEIIFVDLFKRKGKSDYKKYN